MFRLVRNFISFCDELTPNPGQEAKEKSKNGKKVVKGSEDPLSCFNPACADKIDFFKKAMSLEANKSTDKLNDAISTATSEGSSLSSNEGEAVDCPLDRSELGRSTWNFLHTLAAYYPDNPSSDQQRHALQLIEAISQLYPCKYCASSFQEDITTSPPRVETRKDLSIWLCEQHNVVNERLGKPTFSCTLEELDKRWKDGVPGCWNYNVKDKLHDDHSK